MEIPRSAGKEAEIYDWGSCGSYCAKGAQVERFIDIGKCESDSARAEEQANPYSDD